MILRSRASTSADSRTRIGDTDRQGWIAIAAAVVATVLAMGSLWPGGLPAWPAASAGVAAVALSWGRGAAGLRASAAVLGLFGFFVGAAQIAILWAAAIAVSYM